MTKARVYSIWLRMLISKAFQHFTLKLTWRGYAIVAFLGLALFSLSVIFLEVLPSQWIMNTTFVAKLESQNLVFRSAENGATISGIAGSRITLREINSATIKSEPQNNDLTQISNAEELANTNLKVLSTKSEDSYLELDSLHLADDQRVEISSSGRANFFSIQIASGKDDTPSEVTVVWNGKIAEGAKNTILSNRVGSSRWQAISPLIEIESPNIDGLIYSPVVVSALSIERLKLSGSDPIATSSLLSGEIQFYVGSYPSHAVRLRAGELTQFSGLKAQITNFGLTENGLTFVLVGKADSVRTGFLSNLREITPSVLDGLRSIQSLTIILSSMFALLLAVLSAVSLSPRNLDGR